jgi:hypothetical protein
MQGRRTWFLQRVGVNAGLAHNSQRGEFAPKINTASVHADRRPLHREEDGLISVKP